MQPSPSHSKGTSHAAQREQTNVKYSKKVFDTVVEGAGVMIWWSRAQASTLPLARSVLGGP